MTAAGFLVFAGVVAMSQMGSLLQERDDNALGRLLGGGQAVASDLEREQAITAGLRSFRENPAFGGGFEQALNAHNIYLQIAVAVGLDGLVGYLLVIGSVVAPLVIQRTPYVLLAYPALAYEFRGLLSNILWSRL